ncbi:MAG: beta-galactosidase trimerization domain-containing protein, partial [Acidobacteria bacterium]|nr:beta-galactosidase trimerization domain-containing protein [Acidobacteriota bacterium]
GDKNQVSVWAEMLMPESAKVLASYDHPFFGNYPAITRNEYGKGALTYEGTFLSDELQKRVLIDVLKMARLTGPDQELPEAVTVKHALGNSGKNLHIYFNFSSDAQKIAYPYGDGTDLLADRSVRKGQTVTLQPWDLAIVEER